MGDNFGILFTLLFCVVVVPIGLYAFGYVNGKRAGRETTSTIPATPPPLATERGQQTPATDQSENEASRMRWILWELQREPMASTLTIEQRVELTQHYRDRLSGVALPRQESAEVPATGITPPLAPAPAAATEQQHQQPTPSKTPLVSEPEKSSLPTATPRHLVDVPSPSRIPYSPTAQQDVEQPSGPDLEVQEQVRHGRELDPALMLLYVGALMIVAAGVIYAAYNWSDFSAMAKLGSLLAVTIAFIAAGWGFGRSERLQPAANTFLTIGALLVPTNAIAAWQVLDGANARPELPLFFGALATAIVHGAFSIRPGGKLYDYFAVIATAIAAASLPAAMGEDARWGAPLTLAVIAGIPVLRGQLSQLNEPRLVISIIAAPVTLAAAISVVGTDGSARWVLPVTLATTTFALLRLQHFAPRYRHVAESLATVAALAIIPSLLIAMEIESEQTWAFVALVTAIVWTVSLSFMPALRQRHIASAMAIESFLIFTASYALFTDTGSHGIAIIVTLIAVIAMTWIAWTHGWRWYLLASAWFLLDTWSATAFAFGIDGSTGIDRLRFAAMYPIVAMLGAFGVQRWWHPESRTFAAIPLWIATLVSGTFVVVASVGLAIDDPSDIPAVLAILVIYAALVLVIAHSTRQPLVLFGYGLIACLVIGLSVERWVSNGLTLPAYLLGALIVALPAIPQPGTRLAQMARPLAVFSRPRPRHELYPLGVTAAIAFAGVLAKSVQSIAATYSSEIDKDLELSTSTWTAYLAVFSVALIGSLWLGREAPDDEPGATIVTVAKWVPLTLGVLIVASITSMLTRELVHASWIALFTAVLIIAIPVMWRTDEPFLREVRSTLSIGGLVLLVAALLLNLETTADTTNDSHLVGQVVVYSGLAIASGAIAWRKAWGNFVYVAPASLAIACWFGTRYVDAEDHGTLLGFIGLAWVIAGIGVLSHARRPVAFAGFPLLISALAINGVSGALILSSSPGEPSRTLTVYWLLSLAGLLFLVSWLYRRRDLALVASGLGMVALTLQINGRSPDNIHAYTVPIAAWLFALGFIERNRSSWANGLLGAGAAFLVVPGFLMAEQTGEFRWLLICLVEGIALFLGGLVLRLRVPIAAGVVTLSVLTLRMLLDVVNALPNWAALLTAGLILLLGGTIWISFRDVIRERSERLRLRWGRLG